MQAFRKVLYSIDKSEFDSYNNIFFRLKEVKICEVEICHKINSEKRGVVFGFRRDLKNEGNNTNNYVEASVRILKDILSRLKAFNLFALMDFVQCHGIILLKKTFRCSFGRLRKGHLLFQKYFDQSKRVLETKELEMLTDNFYHVESESQGMFSYEVSNGVCSYVSGMQGAFCKHQASVLLKYKISFPNSPELSVENKREFCYIPTGNDYIRSPFLDPMMATSSDKQVKEATDYSNDGTPEETEAMDFEKNISTTEERKKEASEKFRAIMKNLTFIIEKEENIDLDFVKKILEKASNIQSVSDLIYKILSQLS